MEASHDDRINLETRVVGGGVIAILLLAILVLYVFPDHTLTNFAWTIVPTASAIVIGAGYFAGAIFFARVVTQARWHRVQAGFLPITAFTVVMLAATLIHWQRFHQGTIDFFLWTGIYIITPFLVPFLWWRQRPRDPGTLETQDVQFSEPVRRLLRVLGFAGLLLCLIVFLWPSPLIAVAPWRLTELVARVFTGWGVLVFAAVVAVAADGRWSATRLLLQSFIVAQVLVLLAVPRIWQELDHAKVLAQLFVPLLVVALVASVGIYLRLERQSQVGSVDIL
jgi:hypothetical protein